MFTGLVEGKGIVRSVEDTDGGKILQVEFDWIDNDLKLGDSISISGACQTVTKLTANRNKFEFYSSYKTLELTNLGLLKIGDPVNLERSVTPTTRLGGHYVQGHVDGTGKVTFVETRDNGKVWIYYIEYPEEMDSFIVTRGSIAVDGISLTVVSLPSKNHFELVLIPETIQKTTASTWVVGSVVNLEIDLVARYLEKMVRKS
ncbi:riboflavin synthase [Leptospira sp. GIMC2001]|uniref:riboflavin synthase n=1 Tax=Leptospira sp. GIMC2001 TaxID=1513297 RepID=UPI00234B13FB|nr:riboflavin synthase [Leptospira sp. GIMC2001]WCL48387.1 riboflavin synthase [Leptospira sp. GIMC2001]